MKKNGFSLIEVMIAVAITGVTALAMSQVMSHFFKFKRYLEASADYNQFLNDVQAMVDNPNRCSNSFGSLTDAGQAPLNTNGFQLNNSTLAGTAAQKINFRLTPLNYTTIVAGGKPPIYNNAQIGVLIKDATIQRDTAVAGVPVTLSTGLPGTNYRMKFRVYGEFDATKIKGPSLKSREYSLNVIVQNSNRRIQNCSSDAAAQACVELGGVYDPTQADPAMRCDLSALFGGCTQSAGFSTEGGRCTEVHPVTNDCTCPTGFSPVQSMDFIGGGGKSSIQIELFGCYKCSGGTTP